jgi:hypothetical protein
MLKLYNLSTRSLFEQAGYLRTEKDIDGLKISEEMSDDSSRVSSSTINSKSSLKDELEKCQQVFIFTNFNIELIYCLFKSYIFFSTT